MNLLRIKRTRTRFSPSVDESELREQSLAFTTSLAMVRKPNKRPNSLRTQPGFIRKYV